MDECFLYRNPPFSFPYAGLFNPLRTFQDNQFAITGPDGDGMNKKQDESRKRKEKKRMSQILYSDNRRQRLNERLRAKLENRKTQDDKLEIKQSNSILSEEDLVTLFDSKDKPKKRKRKKRKKKKKKAENKDASLDTSNEASNKEMEEITTEAADIISNQSIDEESLLEDSESPKIELSSANELDELLSEGEKKEEDIEKVEETSTDKEEIEDGSVAEESAKGEHLSCGESSTSSIERSTSEHDDKEAGETVSNDEAEEQNEEERSTISPEERGHLTEMVLDDEFPWHLYQTDEDNFSRDPDEGFTVVKRKEKRQRKPKISPRKKKRRCNKRNHRRKEKKKEQPTTKTTLIKNSPRKACPIRPVIQKISKPEPPIPPNLKADPTLAPVPPPGFETINSQINVPSLTKPFEQIQSVNAVFMKMPLGTIITIPFLPFDGLQEVPDVCPMHLDLSYPLDCTIPYYVFPEQPSGYVPQHGEYVPQPSEYVPQQYG